MRAKLNLSLGLLGILGYYSYHSVRAAHEGTPPTPAKNDERTDEPYYSFVFNALRGTFSRSATHAVSRSRNVRSSFYGW